MSSVGNRHLPKQKSETLQLGRGVAQLLPEVACMPQASPPHGMWGQRLQWEHDQVHFPIDAY